MNPKKPGHAYQSIEIDCVLFFKSNTRVVSLHTSYVRLLAINDRHYAYYESY